MLHTKRADAPPPTNAPPPTQAVRDILPMSTGVPILPNATVTPPPTKKVPSTTDWVVNDIKIGNQSRSTGEAAAAPLDRAPRSWQCSDDPVIPVKKNAVRALVAPASFPRSEPSAGSTVLDSASSTADLSGPCARIHAVRRLHHDLHDRAMLRDVRGVVRRATWSASRADVVGHPLHYRSGSFSASLTSGRRLRSACNTMHAPARTVQYLATPASYRSAQPRVHGAMPSHTIGP